MGRGPKCDGEIIKAINVHWMKYCLPPSLDDLVNNTCIASKNTMYLALRRLAKKKHIKVIHGKAVPIKIYYLITNTIRKEYESEESQKTS